MGRRLVLDLPTEVYDSLEKNAERSGRTPEELGAEWIAQGARQAEESPLLALAGAVESDVTDAFLRHDDYLGQALHSEMRSRDGDGGDE
jgi:hypothetical protein